jgi:hypothetical protein
MAQAEVQAAAQEITIMLLEVLELQIKVMREVIIQLTIPLLVVAVVVLEV